MTLTNLYVSIVIVIWYYCLSHKSAINHLFKGLRSFPPLPLNTLIRYHDPKRTDLKVMPWAVEKFSLLFCLWQKLLLI